MVAWADVPGRLCKASPGDGAQRDRAGLPPKPAIPGQPDFPCRHPAKLPPRPAAGRRSRARSNQGERAESVVPSSLAPGPAFGLLKALLQRCQFSLIRTSKPELPNILERACRLPKRRGGQGRRRGKLRGAARSWAARGRASAAPAAPSAARCPGAGGREGRRGLRPHGSRRRSPRGGGRQSCHGKVRDGSWAREGPFAARPPKHRTCTSEKNRFCKKTQNKQRRCSCTAKRFSCPTAVASAALSLRDGVSLLCSAVAQHPSSELIRSMQF